MTWHCKEKLYQANYSSDQCILLIRAVWTWTLELCPKQMCKLELDTRPCIVGYSPFYIKLNYQHRVDWIFAQSWRLGFCKLNSQYRASYIFNRGCLFSTLYAMKLNSQHRAGWIFVYIAVNWAFVKWIPNISQLDIQPWLFISHIIWSWIPNTELAGCSYIAVNWAL